jgi:hypothetical protein
MAGNDEAGSLYRSPELCGKEGGLEVDLASLSAFSFLRCLADFFAILVCSESAVSLPRDGVLSAVVDKLETPEVCGGEDEDERGRRRKSK